VRRPAILAAAALLPSVALAQTAGRSVLVPPNAIDRANASTDARSADARRAADADRLSASAAASRDASRTGPPPTSTMTDRPGGFSTSQTTGAPVTPAPTPPRA